MSTWRANLALLALCLLASNALAILSYSRVHLVDQHQRRDGKYNLLFRGNFPSNETAPFSADTLFQFMRRRAAEHGIAFPADAYLVDVSFNNWFEEDYHVEHAFWETAPAGLGKLVSWPLGLAGLIRPHLYPEPERRQMAKSTVWEFDQLPERIPTLRSFLLNEGGRPNAIYVHCTAGCDRTGEVVGAYRIMYQNVTTREMYQLSCTECGRCPNYFGTGGLEWYCYYHQYEFNRHIGDCSSFATCKLFGHCQNITDLAAPAPQTTLTEKLSPVFPLPQDAQADLAEGPLVQVKGLGASSVSTLERLRDRLAAATEPAH